jgi:DNA (cytosine-5)-methyltransferase 1
MSEFRVLDLFCGAGGASCGIDMAGFDLVAAIDTDTDALDTHAANLPGYTIRHDLSDVDPAVLPERAQSPAYIHGSPPCKGFSTANDDRHIDDERNALVFDFINWVETLQPAAVTMENVTGMLSISAEFMGRVEAAFQDAGYRVKYRTLNAADYGVPQTRKRVITVGVREDINPPSRWFPQPTHAETATTTLDGRQLNGWVTVAEAIGDLTDTVETTMQGVTSGARWRGGDEPSGTVGTNGTEYARPDGGIANHVPPDHSDEVRERLAEAESGVAPHPAYAKPDWDQPAFALVGGHQAAPILPDGVPNHDPREATDSEPMDWESGEPSPTLTDGRLSQRRRKQEHGNDAGHWDGARLLTVRECARLQSFPDWFVFQGTKTSQYAQVGNAVPPRLQYHISRHLRTTVLDQTEVDG